MLATPESPEFAALEGAIAAYVASEDEGHAALDWVLITAARDLTTEDDQHAMTYGAVWPDTTAQHSALGLVHMGEALVRDLESDE